MANVRSIVKVDVAGAAARSTALDTGYKYCLSAPLDLYWLQGDIAVTVTATTGAFLKAGAMFVINPSGSDNKYVSVIKFTGATDGPLTIARMENE